MGNYTRFTRDAGMAILLAGTGLAGLATPVMAQDAQGETATSDDGEGITDIIVTARRRDETLQDTPVAITAIQPAALTAKATVNIGDLQGAAPNVVLTNDNTGAGTAQIAIRGMSFNDVDKSFDLSVGMSVDGVFLGNNTGAFTDFFDIESIEILRGPQGTLFGRNTIGGVINIRRTRPTGELGLKAEATVANYDQRTIRAVGNAPIIPDVLAFKAFYFHNEMEGYYREYYSGKPTGGSNSDLFGGSLLFTPSANFDALLTVEKLVMDYQTTQSSISKDGELFCLFAPAIECNREGGDDLYTVFGDTKPGHFSGPSQTLEMNLDLGFTKLTSITGLRRISEVQDQDFDGLSPQLYSAIREQHFRQFSQELRAAGQFTDTFDYVIGAYYYKSRYTLDQKTNLFGVVDPNANQFTTGRAESQAIFGDFNWAFADKWRLSFGGRYTHDEKQNELRVGASQYPNHTASFSKFTPKVGVDFRPNDNLMLYASWSRGYRSGGFSGRGLTAYSSSTPFGPETVDSYEAGFKATLLDRKLFFNATAFYADYSDLQQNTTIPLPGGVGNETIVTNVGSAKIKGIEADFTAKPADGLKLTGSIGYLHSGFRDFITQGAISALRPEVRTIDYSAVDLVFAPKITAAISATYDVPTNFGEVSFYGGYRYLSPYDFQIAIDPSGNYPATGTVVVERNDPRVRSDAWNIADASVTARFDTTSGVTAHVTGFVRNILDDRGPSKAFTVAGLWSFSQVREPRTYGVAVGFEF